MSVPAGPDMPTRVQMGEAIVDASRAARAGRPITACPYRPADSLHAQRMTRIWVRAYLRIRPDAADAFLYAGD